MAKKSEVLKENTHKEKAHTSPVWSYFKVCEDNPVWADCLLCGVRMSRGGTAPNRCGTTNLRRHVLCSHNITLPSAKPGVKFDGPQRNLRKKQLKLMPSVLNKSAPTTHKKAKPKVKKCPAPLQKVKPTKEPEDNLVPEVEPVMCIRWNTYLNNMTSTLPDLLHDEQFVDVTLACEGQSLKCHKILLAACSPYFYELLSGAACKHPIIMFKDYHFWELQALVAFMYSGEVNVPQSQLPRILRVAEALQIKGLANPSPNAEPPPDAHQPSNDHQMFNETSNKESSFREQIMNKRKRKPSLHNCCKNPPKNTIKPKHKLVTVKPRSKLKSVKRKVMPPTKKLKLTPNKKFNPKKVVAKGEIPPEDIHNGVMTSDQSLNDETTPTPSSPLLPSEMPDMLNDILGIKEETSDTTERISLPEPHAVGSVEGMFPLEDLEGMKMEIGGSEPGIGRFLTNGLHEGEQFDLLPDLHPECTLDEDEEGRR
ncbi:uncharacterized protein LOC124357617 [Homalodisca vitripennis]|uniref:uncharacterized protein LOC124357617 n=1 Tax=Homalodisca vitripennis TaxID=197043 RepID=UPI001EEB5990|nr:uncharacterized protein LOC124357617 [Homalodisca vitripennis]